MMAEYERELMKYAWGDPTVMLSVYEGLDRAGFFADVNVSDGPAGAIDNINDLNDTIVRRGRIVALACDLNKGPAAWKAVKG